ncbi:MAG: PAS domain S-box protein [Thermoplasmatota archaeon]
MPAAPGDNSWRLPWLAHIMPGSSNSPSPSRNAEAQVSSTPQSARRAKSHAKRGVRKPRTWLGRWLQNLRISRKLAVVITVHLLHATMLLALTAYGVKAVDASRAYVGGEGLWSKAEKEAVLSLLVYADTGDEAHFQAYLQEVNVTLGDRQARLELEKSSPDMGVVRIGFMQGRNHPDDVDNMAWLFRTFRHEEHISKAISIWGQADENITTLMALADELHAERRSPQPDPARVEETTGRILDADKVLTGLEHEFSTTLGEGARFVNFAVVTGTVGLTAIFVGSALLVSATVARHITRSLGRVKTGADQMAAGELGTQIDVEGRDDVAGVAQAFNAMSQQLPKGMREREEQALAVRDSEARFRGLAEATREGIIIHDGQRILATNAAFAQLFRYEASEMTGLPIMNLVAPESREDVTRHAQAQSPEAYQLVGLRKDGSRIALEAMGGPFPWQGEVARVVSVRDLTEWEKLETQFRDLLESAPDAMVLVDSAGQIVLVNKEAERLLGYTRQELLGQPIELLVPESRRAAHVGQRGQYMAHASRRPMGRGLELAARRKDGTEFPVEISLSPVESAEGPRVIATIRDITDRHAIEKERREAQERVQEMARLQEVDRFKTQFINMAAHELRTPLTPLRMQVHAMLINPASPPSLPQQQALGVMKRNVERLATLVEDLLTVARSQAGRLGFEPEPIDLGKVLAETAEAFQAVSKDRGIEFALPPVATVPIVADPKRISQVLANLLSNAFKFTRRGGRVRVEVADEGMNVRVNVIDTGAGIAPSDLPRLFKPFVQVHDTTQITEPGSGLGLYICKQFIEMHGGAIGAESPGKTKGSTFWFTLPKAAAPRTPAPDAATQRENGIPIH